MKKGNNKEIKKVTIKTRSANLLAQTSHFLVLSGWPPKYNLHLSNIQGAVIPQSIKLPFEIL